MSEKPKGLKRKSIQIKNIIMLISSGIISAFGVTLFLFPVKLYDSGFAGVSMLLDQITPSYLTLPIFLLILNLPVFIISIKNQGLLFAVYSIISVTVFSVTSYLITDVLPIDVSFVSPLAGTDLLLCAIFGGLICGCGSGLAIRYGGAIDGVEVLAILFSKKIGLSIGSFVLIFNTVLYIVCGILMKSWILPLYSIVTYFVGSKTVDFIVEGFNRSICAMIITDNATEVTKGLSDAFSNSGTVVNSFGGYTKKDSNIIYFILNQFQVNKLKNVVLEIDPKAYIALQEVSDVIKMSNENATHD